MTKRPVEIQRHGDSAISIRWNDNSVQTLSGEKLRRACPCATCRAKAGDASHEKPLTSGPRKSSLLNIVESSLEQETRLANIWSVGQYALGMEFQDGHSTGIYTYSYLESLAESQGQSINS